MIANVRERSNLFWIFATLYAQTAWGAYPVLVRYLQTVTHLPSMSLMSLGSLLALVVVGVMYLPRMDWQAFKSRKLLFFVIIVVARGTTNILAARFTLATYVQLITLLTPFLVALLSTAVLREELPRYTLQAMGLSVFGALLLMGDSLMGPNNFPGAHRTDWLGISLALGGSLLLAIYMVMIRSSVREQIRGEALLTVQLFSLGVATGLFSIVAGEDWSPWRSMRPFDWLIFGAVVLGVFVGANLSQIGAIRRLSASVVSSTMPWRLVSTLVLAALLLDERLTTFWQALGVIIVLVTVTWYLWRQRA
ncbi:MAG: DMT family transporter [Candidatus Promineifilaceae bacterium]|nr:DMT family transporter [Candidatus Promineifilaceae bacterium]